MIVLFNKPEEFIEELRKEFPEVSDGVKSHSLPKNPEILRITSMFSSKGSTPGSKVSLVATTKMQSVPGDILRLEYFCGESWGEPAIDNKVFERARVARVAMEALAKELNLEIRAGILEP
ncbi:MAG: hypothetical protein ACYDHZ_00950 [Dehalococcoidia bacterium]